MTSTLPSEVRDAFERFITCELTTVDANKQPITWPVTPYYAPGRTDDRRDHRASAIRRRPTTQGATRSVSLLFSDPTGSGLESGQRVLVQGTAMVDDEDLKANARPLHQRVRG